MRGNRGRGRASLRRITNRTNRMVRGHTVTPRFDPPAIVDKPWNSAVIQVGNTGDDDVTISDIHKVALSQMGIVSTQTCEYRVRSVRVWGLSVSRPIRVSFFGFAGNDKSPLAEQLDWGTTQRFPRIGYSYPASFQLYSFTSSGKSVLFHVDVGKDSAGNPIPWLAYVDLLWRSDVSSPVSQSIRVALQFPTSPSAPRASTSHSVESAFSALSLREEEDPLFPL